MSIGDYLRIVRRYWWIAVVCTVVGAAAGYLTSVLATPSYESTARLFVSTQSGTSVGEAYQNNLFSQERVVSYAGLAASEQVAARVVAQLNAPISAEELRGKIAATPVEKTVLLDVSVTDADPATAQTYANAVSDQLVQVISELETSRRGGTPAAGAVVVDDAAYPVTPIGPTLLSRILLGVVAGLALGLLLTIGVGLLDTRLRHRDGAAGATGSLVLTSLPADPRRPDLAVADLDAGGPYVERLAELTTNLQFARTADRTAPKVIAVTSPARGDGRSTVAIDLAAALAKSGQAVVLVDGDLREPVLANWLPLSDEQREHAESRGLTTVLAGEHQIGEAVIDSPADLSFALLPAGPVPTAGGPLWRAGNADEALSDLSKQYDYVIVDTPALTTGTDAALVAALADGALVVVRLGRTRTPGLRRAMEMLSAAHANVIGTVANAERGHRGELARHRKLVEKS